MIDSADARRLRITDQHNHDELTRLDPVMGQGSRSRVATVVTGYANAFCAVNFASVLGTETAGSAGTITTAAVGVALNLGTTAPSSGTNVITTFVDYRWVFRYD